MTVKKQELPLDLPSHEQLGQEAMMTYSLAMHSGEPSTREQQIASEAHEHNLLIGYQALKGMVAAEEMKKVHMQTTKGLYAIAEHHDGLVQDAQRRELQSKDFQAKVEQFTLYDLESAVVHLEKIAGITFQNVATELLKPITPPSEPEVIVREVVKEVERPGLFRRLLGG